MQKQIDSAYAKIESIYKTGGDKFIIHLIRAFLPIDEMNQYLSTDKVCAITGKRGLDVDYMASKSMERLRISLREDANELAKAINKEIIEYFDIDDDENIMETRRMFYSETSDKCLSTPAIIALMNFATNQMLSGDRKVLFAIKDEQFKTVKNITRDEARVAAKKSSGFKLSGFEVDAFQELKEKFKG